MNPSATPSYLVESDAPLPMGGDERQTLARILAPEVRLVVWRRPAAPETNGYQLAPPRLASRGLSGRASFTP